MNKKQNLQLIYEKLTKSIRTKIELVGWTDNIDSLELCGVKDYSKENIERLQIIEKDFEMRVTKYNCIVNFFNPLTNEKKSVLRTKSDIELEKGNKIIENCCREVKLYEEQHGKKITDMKKLLSKTETSFFNNLFAPDDQEGSKTYRNVDKNEEYLTEEEFEIMYGENATPNEINKQLELNIEITS